jgi:hypothetical protein
MTHDTPCLVVGAGGASRDRTGDLLVANQTLSQLSYGPLRLEWPQVSIKAGRSNRRASARRPIHALSTLMLDMVGLGGVEPPTSPLSGVRSNQLSYRPGGQRRLCPHGHQLRLEQVICDGGSRQAPLALSL